MQEHEKGVLVTTHFILRGTQFIYHFTVVLAVLNGVFDSLSPPIAVLRLLGLKS